MWIKLLEQWRDNKKGCIINVGENRGSFLMAAGIATKADEPKRPVVETAMIDVVAETAEVTPKKRKFKKE